ncbi:MAG: sulfurtransferase [Nitrososphaerota archaeon]|nr:sulfurtransferase [Nitrososphaerota archaeon]
MNSTNYKGFENDSLIISVEEASKLLGNRNVIFIDTRNYWKYTKGHIPGAYDLELFGFHWVDTSEKGVEAFVKQMQMLLRSLGIDKRKQVIFYQNNSGYDAARGVWLLNYMGHRKAKLLDGGLNLWKRSNLPVSTRDPPAAKQSKFVAKPDRTLIASLHSLSSGIKNGSFQIIDSRYSAEYSGKYHRALRAGHVPNSINIEWSCALRKDGTLKNAQYLRRLYSKLDKRSETVTYCQSGYRAAHSWFVLKLLGYEKVRNYLGSWYEWGNNPETQIVQK